MKSAQVIFFRLTLSTLCAVEKWQAVYTVLEAFGNASTCMNGNASRFSHAVSLDFDQTGMVTSASIQVNTKLYVFTPLVPDSKAMYEVNYVFKGPTMSIFSDYIS